MRQADNLLLAPAGKFEDLPVHGLDARADKPAQLVRGFSNTVLVSERGGSVGNNTFL